MWQHGQHSGKESDMRIFANPFQVPTPRQPIRKLRIAVVGTGHWGTNLARNLHASRDWQVAAI